MRRAWFGDDHGTAVDECSLNDDQKVREVNFSTEKVISS
jgi:hypothetical protein